MMPKPTDGPGHRPVLYHEIIHALQPTSGGLYVDGTLGAGGHAWGILQASAPDGRLMGLDVDPQALSLAKRKLSIFSLRATLVRASYTTLSRQLGLVGWKTVNGILLDLGASSMQFNMPERGFSFQVEASLDMRFDPDNPVKAVDLVNELSEESLADMIYQYGEERHARRIARAIVNARPVHSTTQLAGVVVGAIRSGPRTGRKESSRDRIHPATRTFQALRIAVNQEITSLEAVLPQAVDVLAPGGRLAVISFHSLEDRPVKKFFRRESKDCLCPSNQPICTCDHHAQVIMVTRKPIRPKLEEVQSNPRSRSARLRVVEKI